LDIEVTSLLLQLELTMPDDAANAAEAVDAIPLTRRENKPTHKHTYSLSLSLALSLSHYTGFQLGRIWNLLIPRNDSHCNWNLGETWCAVLWSLSSPTSVLPGR
jgi:hypothetical protein